MATPAGDGTPRRFVALGGRVLPRGIGESMKLLLFKGKAQIYRWGRVTGRPQDCCSSIRTSHGPRDSESPATTRSPLSTSRSPRPTGTATSDHDQLWTHHTRRPSFPVALLTVTGSGLPGQTSATPGVAQAMSDPANAGLGTVPT